MLKKILVIASIILILINVFSLSSVVGFENLEYSEDKADENSNLLSTSQFNKHLQSSKSFIPNLGQLENSEIRFFSSDRNIWFTDDGVWFDISDNQNVKPKPKFQFQHYNVDQSKSKNVNRYVIKQEFIDANRIDPIGNNKLEVKSNYFFGNDPTKWVTEVSSYQEIYYKNLYDGIDLRYYYNQLGLKYDFIIHPGADVEQIKIRYVGIDSLKIDISGNLVINTPYKSIYDNNLFIYQENAGTIKKISGKFKTFDDCIYGFELSEDYDHTQKLIIDPVIHYSTYIGGSSYEYIYGIAADSTGNAYATGVTGSFDFPNTTGAINNSHNGGGGMPMDIIILKLSSDGSSLLYSTYLGGAGDDNGYDIKIDSAGNAYITGETQSSNFPVTIGANDTIFSGSYDSFVTKINHNGTSIIYSTFLGGSSGETGNAIDIDSSGNTYVVGRTYSMDFPTTPGANDTTLNGSTDGFFTKLNPNGATILISTYLGGAQEDYCNDLYVDNIGDVYITGHTRSQNFYTTPGALMRYHNQIFVVKLVSSGSSMIYSTKMGGNTSMLEEGLGITVDSNGNAFVTGYTRAEDFITTPNAYDPFYNGGPPYPFDGFVFVLNSSGSKLIYSTYLGGTQYEYCYDIVIDSKGYAYVTGYSDSSNYPTTPDAMDSVLNGSWDGFFARFTPDGSDLNYSTYLGGDQFDQCRALFIDSMENVYIAGGASMNFITTKGAYSTTCNGGFDAFIIKLQGKDYINITSLDLYKNSNKTSKIYAKLCPYTFELKIIDTLKINDIEIVQLVLDPNGLNIQYQWNGSTEIFMELNDPNDYVILDQSSSVLNDYSLRTTLYFNLTFNWTYPNELLQDVQVKASSLQLSPVWLNMSDFYQVENDLTLNGTLVVTGENDRVLSTNDLVGSGERLNWTNLTVVYEGTNDTYPPADEVDVNIWDEDGYSISDSPVDGQAFKIETITPYRSDSNGYTYTINLSGIPEECDSTSETFSIRIDASNVTFSEPTPNNIIWQTNSNVNTGIRISDNGGGLVNGSTIMSAVSIDNGTTWSDWQSITGLDSQSSIEVFDVVQLQDGFDNLVKWRAKDSFGNGPAESYANRILVDTENVTFSNSHPLELEVSFVNKVEVGITISDNTSGVNTSTLEYSLSSDSGSNWADWTGVTGFQNGLNINIKLDLTIPNGTENRIKWRAEDIAGNGPIESSAYTIIINTWVQKFLPKVSLNSPENESIITNTSVEISWTLETKNIPNVVYDIKLDTIYPPKRIEKSDHSATNLLTIGLENGKTYYWTVIPKNESYDGLCLSGVWSFTVNTNIPIPKVTLVSPTNGEIVDKLNPTLSWSLFYNGPGMVTYDISIWQEGGTVNVTKGYTTTQFIPGGLVEGVIYNWKVLPKAGNIIGQESKTWVFSIKLEKPIPKIDLSLILSKSVIELKPGENTTLKARVTNLGDLKDSITLNIDIPQDSGLQINIDGSKTVEIDSNKMVDFDINVEAQPTAKKQDVVIKVNVTSIKASEHEVQLERNATLKVKILELIIDENGGDGKSDDSLFYISIALILIIVIVIIIVLFLFLKKKKGKEKIEEEPVARFEADESVPPQPVIPPGQTTQPGLTTETEQPGLTQQTGAQIPSVSETPTVDQPMATPQLIQETETSSVQTTPTLGILPEQQPTMAPPTQTPQLPPASEVTVTEPAPAQNTPNQVTELQPQPAVGSPQQPFSQQPLTETKPDLPENKIEQHDPLKKDNNQDIQ